MAAIGTAYVDVKADLKGFDDEVERAGKGLVSKFGGFAKTAGKAIAVGLAGAFVGGAVFAKQAIDAASDLNESVSKVGVVFGDAGKDVIAFSKTTAKSLGQSQRQSLEAAGTFGNLFRALGLTEQQSGKMSTSLVTLAGDLASFNNVDPATALDALRSGLVGETEPLRQFGVNINEATLQAKALELGLISSTKQALDPATKAQAAYALVMDQTALAQGDFARTSGGLANQQRILRARFDDLTANIGTKLLPVAVGLANWINDSLVPAFEHAWPQAVHVAGQVLEWLGANVLPPVQEAAAKVVDFFVQAWPQIKAVAADVLASVGAAAQKALGAIRTGFEYIINNRGALIAAIVAVGAVAVGAFTAWAASAVAAAAASLAAAAPFVAAAAAVAAVAAAFIYAYTQIDAFRTAVDSTVSWIRDTAVPALQEAWTWIQDQTAALVAYVAERWTDIQTAVDNVVTYLKVLLGAFLAPIVVIWQAAHDQILAIVQVAWDTIRLYVETAINVIKGIIDLVLGLLSGDWGRAWDGITAIVGAAWGLITGLVQLGITAVQSILAGAWEVIKAVAATAWDQFKSIVSSAADAVVDFVSKLPGRFKDALGDLLSLLVGKGSDLIFGLLRGIEDKAGDVLDWLVHLPEKVISWVGDLGHVLFDKGESLIQGFIDGIKAKAADIPGIIARAANPGLAIGDFIGSHIPFIGGRASGGLIDRPMVSVIGEAGAEAVINRDQALRLVWNLANASSGSVGAAGSGPSYQFGPNTINEKVDGDTITNTFRRMEMLHGMAS